MSDLQATTKFHKNIGIELTFVPARYNKAMDNNNWHSKWADLAHLYRQKCYNADMTNCMYISRDPGCVEYPSPILKSWKEAEEFYKKATAIAKTMGLTTFHPKQEGGMGHIHMGMTRTQAGMIMSDIALRPYLGWILSSPNGSNYCQSLKNVGVQMAVSDPGHSINNSRYVITNYNTMYRTLEFRAFDAADSWETQEEHIAFYQRYSAWAINQYRQEHGTPKKVIQYPSDAKINSVYNSFYESKDKCIKDFKDLIVNKLELPWDRYEWYIERNLDSAFEFGARL